MPKWRLIFRTRRRLIALATLALFVIWCSYHSVFLLGTRVVQPLYLEGDPLAGRWRSVTYPFGLRWCAPIFDPAKRLTQWWLRTELRYVEDDRNPSGVPLIRLVLENNI